MMVPQRNTEYDADGTDLTDKKSAVPAIIST